MIVLITGITLSTWDVYATAVGDTTKAYFHFSPTAKLANGVFSPDKLRCVPVRVEGAGSGGRFRRVPVCAGVGSGGRFRRVPESSGEFRRVPESSGVCWCRFWRQVPKGSGEFRCVLV